MYLSVVAFLHFTSADANARVEGDIRSSSDVPVYSAS